MRATGSIGPWLRGPLRSRLDGPSMGDERRPRFISVLVYKIYKRGSFPDDRDHGAMDRVPRRFRAGLRSSCCKRAYLARFLSRLELTGSVMTETTSSDRLNRRRGFRAAVHRPLRQRLHWASSSVTRVPLRVGCVVSRGPDPWHRDRAPRSPATCRTRPIVSPDQTVGL